MEFILIMTAPNIKVIGSKTSNKVTVLKYGQMELSMKVTTSMERSKETENSAGKMDQLTTDNFTTTIFMEKVPTDGLIRDSLKVTGRITKCMARVCLLGTMEEHTKETMKMTRNTAMVFSNGQTEEATKANGTMVNNTAKGGTKAAKEKKSMEDGKKEKESNG